MLKLPLPARKPQTGCQQESEQSLQHGDLQNSGAADKGEGDNGGQERGGLSSLTCIAHGKEVTRLHTWWVQSAMGDDNTSSEVVDTVTGTAFLCITPRQHHFKQSSRCEDVSITYDSVFAVCKLHRHCLQKV